MVKTINKFLILALLIFCPPSFVWADVRNIQDNYRLVYNIIDAAGDHVTGQTVLVQIQRASDGYWLDFNDTTFKNTGWTAKTTALTEDSTNGLYHYTFNPPASESGPEQYVLLVDNNDSTYADHQSEVVTYQGFTGGGSGPSAADIADAVLDEALSGHTTAGTLGKTISDIKDSTDGDKEGSVYTGIENTIRSSR